jgi:hypothetical protein
MTTPESAAQGPAPASDRLSASDVARAAVLTGRSSATWVHNFGSALMVGGGTFALTLMLGGMPLRQDVTVAFDVLYGVLVAAEFKYEPSHDRSELRALPGKLPVASWRVEGVAKDVVRVREFVEAGKARTAYAVFIDERRYFRKRPAHPGSAWRGLGTHNPRQALTLRSAVTLAW